MGAEQCGALPMAASAFPLFPSKRRSHKKCVEMLSYCLKQVIEDAKKPSSHRDIEEESLMRELFTYGLKLESFPRPRSESIDCDNTSIISAATGSKSHRKPDELSVASDWELALDDDKFESTEQYESWLSRFFARFSSALSTHKSQEHLPELKENEIHDAASTFILSGFQNGTNSSARKLSALMRRDTILSIVNVVGDFLMSVTVVEQQGGDAPATAKFGWTIAEIVAGIFMENSDEAPLPALITTPHNQAGRYKSAFEKKPALILLGEELASLDRCYDDGDRENLSVHKLKTLIKDCSDQIATSTCKLIFEMILMLLNCPEPEINNSSLINAGMLLIGVVAGHNYGGSSFVKEKLLQPHEEDWASSSSLVFCYNAVLKTL